jgi:hypothetical protein
LIRIDTMDIQSCMWLLLSSSSSSSYMT